MLNLSAHPKTVISQAKAYILSGSVQMELATRYFNAPFEYQRKEIKDRLVLSGLYFVATNAYTIADSRGARGREYFPDLVSTGMLQLIKEFDRYDVHGHEGTPFVGFASSGVHGALLDYRRKSIDSVVRLPEGFDYKRYRADYSTNFGAVSASITAREYYPTPYTVDPRKWLECKELTRRACLAFQELTPRQQAVVEGVLDGQKQPEIAENLNVSEQTIQRDRTAAKQRIGNFMS